jgi:hypothetical protein
MSGFQPDYSSNPNAFFFFFEWKLLLTTEHRTVSTDGASSEATSEDVAPVGVITECEASLSL